MEAIKKTQTCCFTGHSRIERSDRKTIKKKLEKAITSLEGVTNFVCGGALGFDTLVALTVLELKKSHPEYRLILVLPCRNQEKGWKFADKVLHRHLLDAADQVIYIAEQCSAESMKQRNQRMVDLSDVCIAYLRHVRIGTRQTIRMAKAAGQMVIVI